VSWAALAARAAELAGLDSSALAPCTGATLGLKAPRPRRGALGSERGVLMTPARRCTASLPRRARPLSRAVVEACRGGTIPFCAAPAAA
jgi:hypothetical protein